MSLAVLAPPKMSTSSNKPVEKALGNLAAILQAVLLAWCGWLSNTILNHDSRLVRVETQQEAIAHLLAVNTSSVNRALDGQQQVLQMLAELKPDLQRLKSDLAAIMEKLNR